MTSPPTTDAARQLIAREIDNAATFLRSILADGPLSEKEVAKQARAAGFSGAILDSAKRLAGITSRKNWFGPRAICKCFLPSQTP